MKWIRQRQSSKIDDRRGFSGKGMATGGGIGSIIYLLYALLSGNNIDP